MAQMVVNKGNDFLAPLYFQGGERETGEREIERRRERDDGSVGLHPDHNPATSSGHRLLRLPDRLQLVAGVEDGAGTRAPRAGDLRLAEEAAQASGSRHPPSLPILQQRRRSPKILFRGVDGPKVWAFRVSSWIRMGLGYLQKTLRKYYCIYVLFQ